MFMDKSLSGRNATLLFRQLTSQLQAQRLTLALFLSTRSASEVRSCNQLVHRHAPKEINPASKLQNMSESLQQTDMNDLQN